MTVTIPDNQLPTWLKRYDGLAQDGSTPITKAAWRRERAAFLHPAAAAKAGKAAAPWLTEKLLNETLAILNLVLPLATDATLRDRIVAHGTALEAVQQKRAAINADAARRAQFMRSHVTAKTGRKVELHITAPSGKTFTAHSYKAAAAMVGRKASSLRSLACQHGGKFTVGYGDEKWLVEKLA